MVANFGFGVLVLTFLVSLYGIGAAIYGGLRNRAAWVESARSTMLLTFPLITLVVFVLEYLLITGDYQVEFVYNVTSNSMPFYLRMTALWGGQAGSLIFWSWLMSAFATAVTLRKWDRDREFLPWVIVVALVTLAFFLGLSLFFENPFSRFWTLPNGTEVSQMFAPAGAAADHPAGWARAEPAAAPSRHDHPPAHALPGLCLLRDPLCLRHLPP